MKKEIRFYRKNDGKEPFTEWFQTLKDMKLRAQIKNRLERVMVGNYGNYKSVGGSVFELRIHYGAGYRLYFAELDKVVVLFLVGGIKKNQAKIYWENFRESAYE